MPDILRAKRVKAAHRGHKKKLEGLQTERNPRGEVWMKDEGMKTTFHDEVQAVPVREGGGGSKVVMPLEETFCSVA